MADIANSPSTGASTTWLTPPAILDALLFLRGRLRFHTPDGAPAGPANAPSVLIAYGAENTQALKNSGLEGKYIQLKEKL